MASLFAADEAGDARSLAWRTRRSRLEAPHFEAVVWRPARNSQGKSRPANADIN
jgi:hypothetical protein